mmetsp:Transcript_27870/g.65743  ORF Transcript_27870/g.65743 Transcript_27870/m.65743 type:complete len:271 (+) Transcript_27870:461-1273(+)
MKTCWPLRAAPHVASKTGPGSAALRTTQAPVTLGNAAPVVGFSALASAAASIDTSTSRSAADTLSLQNRTVPTRRTRPRSTLSHCGLVSVLASAVFMHVPSLSVSTAKEVGGSLYLKKVDWLAAHVALRSAPQLCTKSQMRELQVDFEKTNWPSLISPGESAAALRHEKADPPEPPPIRASECPTGVFPSSNTSMFVDVIPAAGPVCPMIVPSYDRNSTTLLAPSTSATPSLVPSLIPSMYTTWTHTPDPSDVSVVDTPNARDLYGWPWY